ncbi:hypothetical protein CY34DRAFT_14536 [Suillus luteus UH-Slu-Lm8-n1]|uniref:Uncharacterized protein n=1 Tax=Suillus luteus UH-Slu-Lm8-n1 TaxID=930992 RepID=A0A0C9ZNH6_9AGAM|nr:hypothetical protein CY34DRAFT_14536 [Suillus luteus UH-Slu-Lm8-n1]
MNIQSASSSATVVEDIQVTHSVSTSTQTSTPLAAIYKENISNADKEAIIESAILSRQHTLEIECILVERNAFPTAAVLNTIRTAQLIERICGLCYLLLPSNIKEDILQAIFIILERTATQIARPPSPHCLNEYVRIPSTPSSETPKPILPPVTPCVAVKNQTTISLSDLELGTQAASIIVSDSSPPPPNARVARREQKRRLCISSKSVSPDKLPVKISPTSSLLLKSPADYNNFISHIDEDETREWEKEHTDKLAEFEERYAHNFSDDPINYANQDD